MPMALRWCQVLLAMATPAVAQDRQVPLAPAPPGTLRITVTLVQVDAVVTDSKGRHVSDLRPEDFEVLQDGEPQPVTHFSFVPEPPPPPPPPPKTKSPLDRLPAGPPPPASPTDIRRAVAIVVDDLALSWESTVRVREALRRYVEHQMQPGDLAAIIRTGGGIAFLEQFTTDRRILLEAAESLKWRFSGRCCVGSINPLPGGEAEKTEGPQFLDYDGVRMAALGALETMETVIRGMKRLPGRKSIVLLSESMRVNGQVVEAIDRLTDVANRSAVSLYAVDPSGLKVKIPGLDASVGPMPADDTELGSMLESLPGGFDAQAGLEMLARRTGGLFFFNNNDIPGLIRKSVDDQLGYYLLGYSPKEGTFDPDTNRAKFHKITVRVRRPGLSVRWKTGFSGVPDELVEAQLPPAQTREQQLLRALVSPFTATGIKLRLTSFFLHSEKSGSFVRSLVYFEGKDLGFKKQEDGMWAADVDVVSTAYRGVNQTVIQGQRRESIRLNDEMRERAVKEGFMYILDTPMKAAGTFLMRAAVRDAETKRLGSATQIVQVPDVRKGQLALSGVNLKLASQELLKKLKQVPQGNNADPWSAGGPAVRRYLPGQSIVYSFTVINPKLKGKAKEAKVETFVRVFRNGRPIYTSEPKPFLRDGRVDDRHIMSGGVLHLGPKLPPGEYLIQVVAIDRNQRKSRSQTGGWIDFEVVGPGAEMASR
jgi:VWFA-related protein